MELNKEEIGIVNFYKNYAKNYNKEFLTPLEKEKAWIQIYQKLPINPSVHSILFMKFDEASVINELDTMVESLCD